MWKNDVVALRRMKRCARWVVTLGPIQLEDTKRRDDIWVGVLMHLLKLCPVARHDVLPMITRVRRSVIEYWRGGE